MRYYYAPMEGITLYPLRNTHKKIFGEGVDKYFTPFVTTPKNLHFKKREKKDILPEHIEGFKDYSKEISVQIMSGNVETFVWGARQIRQLGYRDLNLNLGCPAPTVINRHKGAGLLTDGYYLEEMLKGIFNELKDDDMDISLKTRLGFYDPDEAKDLMESYARFPVKELIIHARVREDYYSGKARIEAFKDAVRAYRDFGGKADICYNGDVNSPEDLERIMESLGDVRDEVSAVMMGRGLLYDPALVRRLCGGDGLHPEELRTYLSELYRGYSEYIPEDRNVICKMLEHWAFLHVHFKDCEKHLKAIRKAKTKGEYTAAVNAIFAECQFV
ncbi:tRNA dihydrouridine synthase [Butyrivibrio sp. FCS014]|uniref:tRNA dihydrouridine synthase n=1 Tax=Butyrivibrio sp. FCS014 TaxID=1408304 RepID=UPI0004666EAC|nr:tRNA-dihydrouridine synthase family protein [Butyrivibrio sp. FCS014]